MLRYAHIARLVSSSHRSIQYSLRPPVISCPHTCTYHLNVLFAFPYSIVSVTSVFSMITLLLAWNILDVFAARLRFCTQQHLLSLICNPLSKFHSRSTKCFTPLCEIFVSLYLIKRLNQIRLFNVLVAFPVC